MPILEIYNNSILSHRTGYVGGRFLPSSPPLLTVRNPANDEPLAELPRYGAAETRRAVEQALLALNSPPSSLAQRRQWLLEIAEAHRSQRKSLATLIALENGKPLVEALGEVEYAAGFYTAAADRLEQLAPRSLPSTVRGHSWTIHARPAGVAGLILPWNFPLAMLAKKLSAAVAAGAPVVVKPAEATPLSSIALFHLLHDLKLPRGLVNLVFGDASAIGKVLCEHPAVRVLSFTGSTRVGKQLAQQAAPHIKRLALELGGNAPFVVFDDAELSVAAAELMLNKFRCSGQTCVCTNRVLVHESIAPQFAALVAEQMRLLRPGAGLDPTSNLGPLVDQSAFVKVRELVQDALKRGARSLVGGVADLPDPKQGWFYPPTLLTNVPAEARCLTEEIFGPVLPLKTFSTESELIESANDTEYGLAAYVFTRDECRAQRVIGQLQFGHATWNTGIGPIPEAPFGGMKQSGLGREGGTEGMLEFVELQTVPTPNT